MVVQPASLTLAVYEGEQSQEGPPFTHLGPLELCLELIG